MDKQQIRDFITANPVCNLATCESDQPRVRMIMIYGLDDRGIVFMTGVVKDLHKQLSANGKAEMCFYNPGSNTMVRAEGTCAKVDDEELKKTIIKKFSFLKPIVERQGMGAFCVWRMEGVRASGWTQETALEPRVLVEL